MIFRFHFFFIFILITTLLSEVQSQSYTKCRYTSFGAGIKTAYFVGDVATSPELLRPGFAVHINRQITPHTHIMLETSWVRLIGDDYTASYRAKERNQFYYLRNLHFINDIKALTVSGKYDLIPNYDTYIKRHIYNFYASYGLAIFHHSPKAKDINGILLNLRPLQTENKKYSSISLGIPVGAGFRYKINMQWDLEMELQYHITLTDYLDDVSGNYVATDQLNQNALVLSYRSLDEIASYSGKERDFDFINNSPYQVIEDGNVRYLSGFGPGNKRGSFLGWDNYLVFTIRLSYNPPSKINCPKFREN